MSKEFIEGLDHLDCNGDMRSLLESILKHELKANDEKNLTNNSIKEKYRFLIEELADEG